MKKFFKNIWSISNTEDRRLFIFWSAVLFCLIFHIVYLNIFHFLDNLNSDIVNAMIYKQKVWETGRLFPSDYIHSTTLLIGLDLFFYIPIYGLTKNFNLSEQLTLIIMLFLQLAALTYLLKQMEFRKTAILFTLSCYLGINIQQYFLFMYSTFYATTAAALFITLGMKINIEKTINGQSYLWILSTNKFKFLLLVFIAIYTGYGSPRLILILYLPVLAGEVLLYLWHTFKNKKLVFNTELFFIIVFIFLTAAASISYLSSLHFHGHLFQTPHLQTLSLIGALDWINISLRIQELSNLFNPTQNILFLAFFLLVLLTTILYIFRYTKNQIFIKFTLYFFAVTLFVLFYMFIKYYGLSINRYYIMTTASFIIILGIAQNESMKSRRFVFANLIVFIAVLLYQISTLHSGLIIMERGKYEDLREAAEYFQKEKLNVVEASYWNAAVLRAFSNGYIITKHWNGGVLTPALWLTDKSLYSKYQNTVTVLLITDQEEAGFKGKLADGEKVAKIGDFNLYKFNRAQLTLFEFPQLNGESREYDSDFWLSNANFNCGNGIATSEVYGGLFSPPVYVKKGVYDFALEYYVIQSVSDIAGEFRITSGNKIIASFPLPKNSTNFISKGVYIENTRSLRILVIANSGNIIEFKKIIVTKR